MAPSGFPIFVELRRMKPSEDLTALIARELALFKGTNYSEEVLLSILSTGQFLLLLDGVDELTDAARPAFCRRIAEDHREMRWPRSLDHLKKRSNSHRVSDTGKMASMSIESRIRVSVDTSLRKESRDRQSACGRPEVQ